MGFIGTFLDFTHKHGMLSYVVPENKSEQLLLIFSKIIEIKRTFR